MPDRRGKRLGRVLAPILRRRRLATVLDDGDFRACFGGGGGERVAVHVQLPMPGIHVDECQLLMPATGKVFRRQLANRERVGEYLIAPFRPLTVSHQPDRWDPSQPLPHFSRRRQPMQQQPIDLLSHQAPGQFVAVGDVAEDQVEIHA